MERDENGNPIGTPYTRDGVAFDQHGNPTGPAEPTEPTEPSDTAPTTAPTTARRKRARA